MLDECTHNIRSLQKLYIFINMSHSFLAKRSMQRGTVQRLFIFAGFGGQIQQPRARAPRHAAAAQG